MSDFIVARGRAFVLHDRSQSDLGAAIDRLTVRFFDRTLERRFRQDRFAMELRQTRLSIVLAIIVNVAFTALDGTVVTENRELALAVRLVWALPFTGLALATTYLPAFQTHMNAFFFATAIASTLFYAALNLVGETPDVYLSGLVIILFFILILFPLDFPVALAIGTACILTFCICILAVREIALGHLLTIISQYLATLAGATFAVYIINLYRRQEFLAKQKIAEQSAEYFDLLTRILPKSIVARMEQGENQIADDVPEAVVLFADIVGFTGLAARHRPEVVVKFLDTLFGRFDELVAANGLEKIKTIGDAYMVAGGVPEPREGMVQAAAELALDMLESAATLPGPDGEPLQLRIGIHSGPLVAGVIGESRFGYDIWGNTVNVASRLQTSAKAGCVQVSKIVRGALPKGFQLSPSGEIELRGLGRVEVWSLIGRNA